MTVYVYCIRQDFSYKSAITGREYTNEWFSLAKGGTVIVKGSHYRGYAWDGCSPKFKFKDLCFGTPEAVLNFATGQSKTYYASLIHDVFYQFAKHIRLYVKRKEVDREFYRILRRDDFRFARVYYIFVRMFGWIWWYK